jgi:hypothetical protein
MVPPPVVADRSFVDPFVPPDGGERQQNRECVASLGSLGPP